MKKQSEKMNLPSLCDGSWSPATTRDSDISFGVRRIFPADLLPRRLSRSIKRQRIKIMRYDVFKDKREACTWLISNGKCRTVAEAEKFLFKNLPKEAYYQTKVIEAIKKYYPKAFVWKAAAGVYCRQGIPDVCAVISGHYFGFEIKRPYIGRLSPIQRSTILKISEAGGTAAVINFPEEALKIIAKEVDV